MRTWKFSNSSRGGTQTPHATRHVWDIPHMEGYAMVWAALLLLLLLLLLQQHT
jgi:hypothetical protein